MCVFSAARKKIALFGVTQNMETLEWGKGKQTKTRVTPCLTAGGASVQGREKTNLFLLQEHGYILGQKRNITRDNSL